MQQQYRADVVPLLGPLQDERFAGGFRMNDFAEFRHFKYLLEVLIEESLRSAAEKSLAGVVAGSGIAVMAANVLSWLWGI